MGNKKPLLEAIALTISDYRQGDMAARTPDDVGRWVSQFPNDVQIPILAEMDYVLKKTYFSRKQVIGFLRGVAHTKKLVGDDSAAFWREACLLDIQGGGASQKEMLALFSKVLKSELDVDVAPGPTQPRAFVYLDDGIFTGNRVLGDLRRWIAESAPANSTLHVIANAVHRGGEFYASQNVKAAAKAASKEINVTWWHAIHLEDRKSFTASSDVLRPTIIPTDPLVSAYVRAMKYQPNLRQAGQVGGNALFSNDAGRQLLEQEFLKAGCYIRSKCPHLGDTQRPLGHMTLDTLGFGSMIVTFRNCPNNAPLAHWAGNPWFPLFPRATNNATAMKRLLENLAKDFG